MRTYVPDPPATSARPLPPSDRASRSVAGRGRRPRTPEPATRGRAAARPSVCGTRISEVRKSCASLARAVSDRRFSEASALRRDHRKAGAPPALGGRVTRSRFSVAAATDFRMLGHPPGADRRVARPTHPTAHPDDEEHVDGDPDGDRGSDVDQHRRGFLSAVPPPGPRREAGHCHPAPAKSTQYFHQPRCESC